MEGISQIDPLDIQFVEEFGYRLKLLAIGRNDQGLLEMRVHPTMIPSNHVLASVKGAYNAVHIHGNAVGNVMFYGLGAGMMPTGSAVVSDLMDLARDILAGRPGRVPAAGVSSGSLAGHSGQAHLRSSIACYYFRFSAMDRPGVLSKICRNPG